MKHTHKVLLVLGLYMSIVLSVAAANGIYHTSGVEFNNRVAITASPATFSSPLSPVSSVSSAPSLSTVRASVVSPDAAYHSYRSPVYEPFSNTLPSATTLRRGVRPGDDDDDGPSSGNAGDPGQQSEFSPVGADWILLLMAILYLLVKYGRIICNTNKYHE